MNDPWDVKSVRHSDQYISCMKINGVPLLPPVLSQECRKEMQYYRLLAKEVEKRISMLSIVDHEESTTDGEFSENSLEIPQEQVDTGFDINIDKITAITNEKILETYSEKSPVSINLRRPSIDVHNNISSNIMVVNNQEIPSSMASPKLVIDLNLRINQNGKRTIENINKKQAQQLNHDMPEKDVSSPKKIQHKDSTHQKTDQQQEIGNFCFCNDNDILKSDFLNTLNHEGPSSLSTKNFTGSLNDINLESAKEAKNIPQLVRQSSYTVLQPSPQLIAHIECQSISTGVDVNSISMSESTCNLDSSCKKRRSWDLETAKIKWSSMAVELTKTNVNTTNNCLKSMPGAKKLPQTRSVRSPYEKVKRTSLPSKQMPKSEPVVRPKETSSPTRLSSVTRTTLVPSSDMKIANKEPGPQKSPQQHTGNINGNHNSETIETNNNDLSEDPATKVRELYEKIQKQQLMQMASLVEKQKREQILLQQVFDEQNKVLFNQLKNICPKSPMPVKEAWGDVDQNVDKPVSLSQLINDKAPLNLDSTVCSTLTLTGNQINDSEDLLKRSKELISSTVKQQKARQNGSRSQAVISLEGSRTQTHSPTNRQTPASRRLKYDTTASSEREIEPILTDRTNDTFADLNVTFPSDNTEDCMPPSHCNMSPRMDNNPVYNSTDRAIKTMEDSIHNSMNTKCEGSPKPYLKKRQFTPRELAAACTIVAYTKGYLTRRLMRTERVQSTVQTIRDALMCALELHQDTSGIRGADVDLHRRLIQQITAACYSLHDTFITSTPRERCAMIAADRGRRQSLASRQTPTSTRRQYRPTDAMSKSHSGVFPGRVKRPSSAHTPMTQSNYETFSPDKSTPVSRGRHFHSPSRRPWR